jgi:HD-like signal output (HDOD) protein/ActR/RegA family two-component response regulator
VKRILFVDDEERVLDGLRRSLRSKRQVWELSFATSAAAAIDELGRGPFDVVVSDMRMPSMDGAEFLRRVELLQPQAARIVLSGQMEESAAMRAATVAHRFLTKPCEPAALEAAICRTLDLRDLLGSEDLRRCLGGMVTLPSLPAACLALNRVLSDKNGSIAQVCAIIEESVGMSAKVLQLVNSAFFGASRRVTDVQQAVSYLGMNTIRNLVLAESLFTAFGSNQLVDAEREQQHSLLASRIARQLLPDAKLAQVAATAALLHDAGSLALAHRLGEQQRQNVEQARQRGVPLHVVERECFGVTHAEVGAYLLGLWALPHDVLEAVAGHHAPFDADVRTLDVTAAVRIAVALAAEILLEPELRELHCEPVCDDVLARFGLTAKAAQLRAEATALRNAP